MSTRDWKITNRQEQRTGVYTAINVQALGKIGASVVTVKTRSLPGGPSHVCLSCLLNECPHVEFVRESEAEQPTPATEAA